MARYIDADKLLKDMEFVTNDTTCPLHIAATIDQTISLAETADVVEVKLGVWIAVPSSDMSTGKAYKCSECGKFRYGCRLPPYCQECGAKMNGKE